MHRLFPARCWMCAIAAVASLLSVPGSVLADGVIVDKVYDPYVQPLETELEWRLVDQSDDELPDTQKQLFGFGKSLSDRLAFEIYVISWRDSGQSLSFDTYEFELKWQLTEQGEYAFDWGMLFELERSVDANAWEFSTGLLTSRDIGRVTATANLDLIYEWGERVQSEVETALHVQTRYRLREAFEPALELHMGQDTLALGPAFLGLWRPSQGKKLKWELGIFAGMNSRSPDYTIKANIEFEF